jgi:N-acetyl-alpha-D-glucosaminyl L-malate synthase BshA
MNIDNLLLRLEKVKQTSTEQYIAICPSHQDKSPSLSIRVLPDEKILCHVSNFRKVKRVEDVVAIFAKVNEKVPSKLILVGDGPERYSIEKLCREYDICDRVIFIGKVRDTAHVLEIADIFLLPSETESFGLAALEAMAVGVPVISSNAGGIPEVNEHGVTGYLSNVGDVEEMVQNTLAILSTEHILNTFKENALKRSHDFHLEKILPMYEKIYDDVLIKKKLVARD